MKRGLESGTRIKKEFVDDSSTNGEFKINACGVSIESSIHKDRVVCQCTRTIFTLNAERSLEPQILIHLEPGKSSTWTQHLVISDVSTKPTFPVAGLRSVRGLATVSQFLGNKCCQCLCCWPDGISRVFIRRAWEATPASLHQYRWSTVMNAMSNGHTELHK
jgi:hypothetical protein